MKHLSNFPATNYLIRKLQKYSSISFLKNSFSMSIDVQENKHQTALVNTAESVTEELPVVNNAEPDVEPVAAKRPRLESAIVTKIYDVFSSDFPFPVDSLLKPIKPVYFMENGFRKVEPYYFKFVTSCKERWQGRALLEVLHSEFHPRSPVQYEEHLKRGQILVQNKVATPDYVLIGHERIENIVHRHEMSVLNIPIQIIHSDNEVLVLNKPCSIPVHPCGRYRHNTVQMLLHWEHGYDVKNLKPLHRLDRLTSGLLIFTRTVAAAQKYEKEFRDRKVRKVYVCRVDGEFPKERVVCNEPLSEISKKISMHFVNKTGGKDSCTSFERMSFNGSTSVVKCFPETGRTHQIRVHLQYLGYPIVNDSLYNSLVFGPQKGKGGEFGKSMDQLKQDIWDEHDAQLRYLDGEFVPDEREAVCSLESDVISQESAFNRESVGNNSKVFNEDKLPVKHEQTATYDPHCRDCKLKYRDPTMEELTMYLHCLEYEGPDWKYSTALPDWAKEGWINGS